MTKENEQLEPIESALLELGEAERASVFARTPVSAEQLLAQPLVNRPMVFGRRTLVWLSSAAAVVLLAAGVWSVMFKYQLDHLRGSSVMVDGSDSAGGDDPCDGNFLKCFSGPESVVLAMSCGEHDYDSDGDVDLADFRNYQIHCNRPPSLTR